MGTFFEKKQAEIESGIFGNKPVDGQYSVALYMGLKLYDIIEKTMNDTRIACAMRNYNVWVSLLRQMYSWTKPFSNLNSEELDTFTKEIDSLIIKANNVQTQIAQKLSSGMPLTRIIVNNEALLRQEIHRFEDKYYGSIKHMLMRESQGDIVDDMERIIRGE